jgi:hypothetical protein
MPFRVVPVIRQCLGKLSDRINAEVNLQASQIFRQQKFIG